jgi:hypothetical protein
MRRTLPYLLPFILCVLAEMNQVEHFPQSASYPVAVCLFQLGSGEVGGYVCFELEAVYTFFAKMLSKDLTTYSVYGAEKISKKMKSLLSPLKLWAKCGLK